MSDYAEIERVPIYSAVYSRDVDTIKLIDSSLCDHRVLCGDT